MVYHRPSDAPALVHAIITGELEDVLYLLDAKEDPNAQDVEKRSPLHAASFFKSDKIVEVLIQNGARVNSKDRRWITSLHLACYVGHRPTVEVLLKHNADVNARDRSWHTPIHIASANNSLSCVQSLLPYITNIDVTDREGRTSLHHAAYHGHLKMVEYLLRNGSYVNVSDRHFRRPLHWAVHMGHSDVVQFLIKNGADVNARDKELYTPLHVCKDNSELVQILVQNGAKIDAKTAKGNTPLHMACLNGYIKMFFQLIYYKAPINEPNNKGQSPLHIAAASTLGGSCMEALLKEGADINQRCSEGKTALHMTAIHGRLARSKILIDQGAIIEAADKDGYTTLHVAALYGHELLSRTLLSCGADPMKLGYLGRTPLHLCCLSGFVECCRKFVQLNLELDVQDFTGKTPLHLAAYRGSIECLDLLVSSGAKLNVLDKMGRIPLHYAAGQGAFSCLYTLVGIGSAVNTSDVNGCTPLHLAAAYDLEGKCVEYLINHITTSIVNQSKDCNYKDRDGFTPVHYAVYGGNQVGLKYLLKVCGYKIADESLPKMTPLHIASYFGYSEILRLLLPHFSNINIKDDFGRTPLHLASQKGHFQCVQLLLRCGALVSLQDNVTHRTPIHAAAVNCHSDCLQLLLYNTENSDVVNSVDIRGRTPLMLAAGQSSSLDNIITLLRHGASVNVSDRNNRTALYRVVVNGCLDDVEALLGSGALVNVKDCNGKSPLHLAASENSYNTMSTLIQHLKEDVTSLMDNESCTVLHWACQEGNSKCVEYLVNNFSHKAWKGNPFTPIHSTVLRGKKKCLKILLQYFGKDSVKVVDHKGRTPLHIAAICNSISCMIVLLKTGADVECRDYNGRTPLILSALHGHPRALEILLKSKADIAAQDKHLNTALHYACTMKHDATAIFLIEKSEDSSIINIVNKLKKTPLHIAASQGLISVTQLLIDKGANVLAVDSKGMTPALSCAPTKNVAHCLEIILSALLREVTPLLDRAIAETGMKKHVNIIPNNQSTSAESVLSQDFMNVGNLSNHSSDSDFY